MLRLRDRSLFERLGRTSQRDANVTRLLLLSGGLDSAAVAAWQRPDHCLVVDYGQAPASAEARAAGAIARDLGLELTRVTVDASQVGAGLMSNAGKGSEVSDAAEWWPFRNQLLITIAGAWAVVRGYSTILLGTVSFRRKASR